MELIVETIDPRTCERGFAFADRLGSTEQLITLQPLENRGYGLVLHREAKMWTEVAGEEALAMIPVGTHSNRVCRTCCRTITKSAKSFDTCSRMLFCSMDCLEAKAEFMAAYADMITQLEELKSRVDLDSLLLMLEIMHTRLHHPRGCVYFAEILRLYSKPVESAESSVSALMDVFVRFKSAWVDAGLVDKSSLITLFCVLRYNAQKLVYPGLAGTHMMCLLPSLARLNHSCAPNSLLALTVDAEHRARCRLVAVRDIGKGEELTISYLVDSCQSLATRRAFLASAFEFHCACSRCIFEEAAVSERAAEALALSRFDALADRLRSPAPSLAILTDSVVLAQQYCVNQPPHHPYCSLNLALLTVRALKASPDQQKIEYQAVLLRALSAIVSAHNAVNSGGVYERIDYLIMGASVGLSLAREARRTGVSSTYKDEIDEGVGLCSTATRLLEALFIHEDESLWSPYLKALSKVKEMRDHFLHV